MRLSAWVGIHLAMAAAAFLKPADFFVSQRIAASF